MKDDDAKDLEIIANRKRFVHALRTTPEVQGRGRFYRRESQSYCALGIYQYFVMDRQDARSSCSDSLGLSSRAFGTIIGWNDTGSSFAEIADKFEKANFPICKNDAPTVRSFPRSCPSDVLDRSAAELRRKKHDAMSGMRPETKAHLQQREKLIGALASAAGESRAKQAGRITLTQWFEKYDGGPKAMETSH